MVWTSGDFSFVMYCGIHLRAILHRVPELPFSMMSLKIVLLKLLPHTPRDNELRCILTKTQCDPSTICTGLGVEWFNYGGGMGSFLIWRAKFQKPFVCIVSDTTIYSNAWFSIALWLHWWWWWSVNIVMVSIIYEWISLIHESNV